MCVAHATFQAIAKTYAYLTPDLWPEYALPKTLLQENADFLAKSKEAPKAK